MAVADEPGLAELLATGVPRGLIGVGIDPDTLSPKEALDALYRLKALQKDSP